MAEPGVSKRGDRWVVVVNLGIDPVTGKRRRKVVTMPAGSKKKEAATERIRLLHQRDTGELAADPTKQTVAEYLRHWLRTYAEPNLRPKSAVQYEYVANHFLIPLLGSYRLSKLTAAHVREAMATLLKTGVAGKRCKPLSAKSLTLVKGVLHRALDHAVKWRMLNRNPADGVEVPKPKRREMQVWTADEARRFLEAAEGAPLGAAMSLALLTGMREGEVLGLRWQDVDSERGALQVVQNVQRIKGRGFVVGDPKTAAGRRRIALPPMAVELLRAHKAKQNALRLQAGSAWQDNGLVFPNALGAPAEASWLRKMFHAVTRTAGLPRLTFHGLRHTHATLLLVENVHPKIVSERLGHSNIGITLNLYSHVLPGLQDAAAGRLETVLRAPELAEGTKRAQNAAPALPPA